VRFVLTDTTLTQVPIIETAWAVVPDAAGEDLPLSPWAGTLTAAHYNCEGAPTGVATSLVFYNATQGTMAHGSIADGNYTDRDTGLALSFAAGDELAIVADNDASAATHAEACSIVLEFK
jgi:hypothetical protein